MQVHRLLLISQAGPAGNRADQALANTSDSRSVTKPSPPRLEGRAWNAAMPLPGMELNLLAIYEAVAFRASLHRSKRKMVGVRLPDREGGHRPFVSGGGTRGARGSLSSVLYLTGTAGDSSAGRRLSKTVAPISCSAWLLIERSIPLRSRSKDTAVSEIRVMNKR